MLDKAKIYVIDFEDSFTFNIASELFLFEKSIVVVSHDEFFNTKNFDYFLQTTQTPTAVILGPGPGDPSKYSDYFQSIETLKNHKFVFMMGICLGHQVIALIDGLKIRRSNQPNHGGQVKINFDHKNILVQRYNSLAVYESHRSEREIMIRQWPRGVSYQFHPESIGTQNRELFFQNLLDFLNH